MARNPVAAAICAVCGTKFNAERDRCPRCRTKVERPDREAQVAAARADAARSRRFQVIGITALSVALAVVGAVWALAPRSQSGVARPSAVDPLAARSRAAAAPDGPDTAAKDAPKERTFMDAPGAASEAYHAGNADEAVQHYEEAIARNPRDAEALSNLGQVLVKQGRADEALPYFNRAIDLDQNRWAYVFNRARAYAVLERWTESIGDYRRAAELFPGDYATAFNLAMALHKSGDEEGAVTEYQKAITLAPDEASFRMALGISLERLKRKAEAAAAYEEALKLAPSAPDADKVKERIAQLTGPAAVAAPAGRS